MHERVIQEIQRRLTEKKLTPISAAKEAGLGRDSIRDILRGKSQQPSYETLRKIAAVLNCTVSDLEGVTDQAINDADRSLRKALTEYSVCQRNLCYLFRGLTGLDTDVAAIIFYGTGSPQARLEIIDQLKKKKRSKDYPQFWRSLVAEIGKVDQAYIELVRPRHPLDVPRSEDYERFADSCSIIKFAMYLFVERPFDFDGGRLEGQVTDVLSRPISTPMDENHPLRQLMSEIWPDGSMDSERHLP